MPAKEISNYIKSGEKIKAVMLAKNSFGLSIQEAKEYVEKLEKEIRENNIVQKQSRVSVNINAIDGMEGHEFEHFCADLLRKTGFSNVKVTPGSGDQGVDILAEKEGIKYAIQCKNYANALGNTPVQEVSAGKQFYSCHVGVVMTNSTFTQGALQLATATNVLLWDRRKLDELITKAGGLEALGIYPNYEIFDDDLIDDDFDDDFDDYEESITVTKNSNRPRKGMLIWSKICISWSIICGLMLLLTRGISNEQGETMGVEVFLGEGIFVLVLGLMFAALAKTEKGNPYMYILGKKVKKFVFVILCIIIAYALFLPIIGLTSGLQ